MAQIRCELWVLPAAMLYFLIAWMLLTLLCTVIGGGVLDLLRLRVLTRLGDRWMIALWLGVLTLALTLVSVSLSLPLSPAVGLLVAGLLCTIAGRRPGTQQLLGQLKSRLSRPNSLLLLLLMVGVAWPMSQEVVWYDTGLYHFGAIRWLNNYGAVPGLSLLVSQFGFFSTWFALNAPFNPEILGTRGTAVINGFIIFLSLMHLGLVLGRMGRGRAGLGDRFLLLFTLMWGGFVLISGFISQVFVSPSTDIPILMLTGLFGWVLVALLEAEGQASPETSTAQASAIQASSAIQARSTLPNDERMLLLLFGAGAVAIKLTALPILPVAWLGYSVIQGKFRLGRALLAALLLFLFLVPAMAYSLVTSGCPLYPSQALCLDLPWAALPEQMATEVSRVTDWMDWFGEPPAGVVPWQWAIKKWITNTVTNVAVVGLAAFGLLGIVLFWKFAKIRRLDDRVWILLLAALGMGFTLTRTLVVRLGLGYFLILPAFFGALFLGSQLWQRLSYPLMKLWQGICGLVVRYTNPLLAVVTGGLVFLLTIQPGVTERLLLPPPLPVIESETARINNLEYNYPIDSEGCWAIELPCIQEGVTPQKGAVLEENLVLLNPEQGVAGGFRLDPSLPVGPE